MSDKKTLTAQVRDLKGRRVKNLFADNLLPANLFGSDIESIALQLPLKEALALYQEAGDTQVVYLSIDGESSARPILFAEAQFHPVTGKLIHLVLRQINLKEKVTVAIPVELIGENKIPGGVVLTVHNEIEVEALPTNLPEQFTVDISLLTEIGQAVTFNDLAFDRSKVTLLVEEQELDNPVVLIQEVKEEVEPEITDAPTEDAAAPASTDATPAA